MSSPPAERWIDILWPQVCARARRPVSGIVLPGDAVAAVARDSFESFLDSAMDEEPAWESVAYALRREVAPRALEWVAAERARRGEQDFASDGARREWEKNPDFSRLKKRTADGALTAPQWSDAMPILRRRADAFLAKRSIPLDDRDDVFMETIAELLKPGDGPLDRMLVFEELPLLFGTMMDRRAISWLRKQNAQKRDARAAQSLDDQPPDSAGEWLPGSLVRDIVKANESRTAKPWEHATWERIQERCAAALTAFEWHVLGAYLVEASHSLLELASDSWVLEQMEIPASASESKRRRALNSYLETALARLGRALKTADL